MLVSKNNSGNLVIPRDIWTKNGSGNLVRVREIWTKSGGSLVQVYGGNVTNYTGDHPYWTYSLNSDFDENDGLLPCWNTFWSMNNAGGYTLGPSNNNRATITIPLAAIATQQVPASSGYYVYTTDSVDLLCNTTQGTPQVVTKNTDALQPLYRQGVDGTANIRWRMSGPFINTIGNPTYINSIDSATQFTMSRNATVNGSSQNATASRTWASSYVPPTSGYTRYYGYTTFQSNYELRISENTSYTVTVNCTGGTTARTSYTFGAITGTSQGGANFFTPGAVVWGSPAYNSTGTFTYTFTSPAGATRARPWIRVDYDSGSTGTLDALPRSYTFERIRFA